MRGGGGVSSVELKQRLALGASWLGLAIYFSVLGAVLIVAFVLVTLWVWGTD